VNRLIVPVAGFSALTVLSFTLIVVVVIRPWGGVDKGWKTHLNLTDAPYSSYTRSNQALASVTGDAPILVWRSADPREGETAEEEATRHFVAHGCASCHGLDGAGGILGPSLIGKTAADLQDKARFGPKGMPAFGESDLTDQDLAALASYIDGVTAAHPELVPTPTATRTPARPTDTPQSTPAPATPAGTSTPQGTVPATATATSRPAVATPQPAAATPQPTSGPVSSPVPTASPTAVPPTPAVGTPAPGDDLLAQGKLLYDVKAGLNDQGCAYCHGGEGRGAGEGASNAPDIRGMSRVQVRNALANVFDMKDIALSSEEIDAVVEYLRYLGEQP
jgi:mono/diheme cytochrome c family protein